MKIFKGYYSLPIPVQNVIFSLYGYHLKRVRYNGIQKGFSEILRKNETIPKEEHEKRQLESLKKILIHCERHVPYYQGLFKQIGFKPESVERLDDLRAIPLLEKGDVLGRSEKLVADNFGKSDIILEETSGTSGSPLKVYWDRKFYAWIYALYEQRMRGSAGVTIKDRRANLTGKVLVPVMQKKPPFWRYNLAEKQMYLSSYHLSVTNIPYYVEALKKFKPKYIIGYPGSIYPLAKYLANNENSLPSVKAVVSCSEYLSDETRAIIEKGFGCKVYNHYGSVEWVAAINECAQGNLHISPEFGIIEIVDEEGKPVPRGQVGEMVCTGLLNYAMPFIRYRTGDMGSFPEKDVGCACGQTLPIMKSLEGRKMSFVSLPDGGTVGSAALSTAFHAENIIESQIIQELKDSIELKLVVTDQFRDSDKEYLLGELEKRIFPLEIRCEVVDSIPRQKEGKKQWIINLSTDYADFRRLKNEG